MQLFLLTVSLLVVPIIGNGYDNPLYVRELDDMDFLIEQTLSRRAYVEELEELILGRREALQAIEAQLEVYARDEHNLPLLARGFDVPHVSRRCAKCLAREMQWEEDAIPAQLTKEEYAQLDMAGVTCVFKNECSSQKIDFVNADGKKVKMSEAAIWAKSQGHTRAQDSGGSSGGSGGNSRGSEVKKGSRAGRF